ncbi:MAG TPA: PAS domain-containing sensor histidine kinase [Actinophytocola sp.]|uniref:sensor histidine kinase n=1 Tax=Actinophytocola sp. TaxID=1872138 RepID=UPI002DBC266F|nr:PAS domain-containing sensor histidine kinase [Actinophytocola sp.]HEU5474193.1 PAS domain-containing sensor histidine kinase [Actinophytocola sp.]
MEQELVETWPEPLAKRIGALLATLADSALPGTVVVPEVVRGLRSVPGITGARLTERDERLDAFPTKITIGPAHVLHLKGPNSVRPDVVQALGLLAEAMAVRLWEIGPADVVIEPAPSETPHPDDQLEFFRALGRHAPFLIAVHDPDGTARWSSRGAPSIEGLAMAPERVHPDDRRRLAELRQQLVAESGDHAEVDVRLFGADDQWRHAHVVMRNLCDNPAVRGVVSYANDVTYLRETEYSQRVGSARLRTLIDAIDVAILVVDENMRLAEINPKALQIMRFQAPLQAVIGCSVAELAELAERGLASREVLRIAADFADRSISGRKPVYGEELHFPDGVVIEADYLPIDIDGVIRGHFLVGREVTGRVAAQHALEARNRELADLALLKNEFLATVSHELRTPLTAASSLLELLDSDDRATPLSVDMVDALRRNNTRLLSIVEDLLLLARFEAGQLPLETRRVPIGSVLGEGLAALRTEAAQYGVSIVEKFDDADVTLEADPHWLYRMIRYVVSGSFASGRPASRIFLRGELGRRYWTLTVSGDTLRTADHLSAGDERARIGIGLGLTLARAIARRHGGELRIAGSAEGAAVRISLPTSPTADDV